MIDYENLPEVAGLDGLASIFPSTYPATRHELFAMWQFHQHFATTNAYYESSFAMNQYRHVYPGIHHPWSHIYPV